jgi:hypothetical protein
MPKNGEVLGAALLAIFLFYAVDSQPIIEARAALIRASNVPDSVKGWRLLLLVIEGMTKDEVRAIFGPHARLSTLNNEIWSRDRVFRYRRQRCIIEFSSEGKVKGKEWLPPSPDGQPVL